METTAYVSYYDPKGNLINKEHQSYGSTREDEEAWFAKNPKYLRSRR
jgi:hypothetical protein